MTTRQSHARDVSSAHFATRAGSMKLAERAGEFAMRLAFGLRDVLLHHDSAKNLPVRNCVASGAFPNGVHAQAW